MRSVKLGRDFGNTVEVLSGLNAGDRVINNPPDSIADGMTVQIAQRGGNQFGGQMKFCFHQRPLRGRLAGLAGCAVGPDYHRPPRCRPAVAENNSATTIRPTSQAAGKSPNRPRNLPRGEWWQSLRCGIEPAGNAGPTNNQNLAAAAARLSRPAPGRRARSDFYPQLTAGGTPNGDITRQRTSVNQPQKASPPARSHTYDTVHRADLSGLGTGFVGARAAAVAGRPRAGDRQRG
jgi:hypothetical protein